MSSQRTTFGKLQRERDKKARAAAKRERRLERGAAAEAEDADAAATAGEGQASAAELLEELEQAHRQYEAEEINHEEFEEQKAAILARLPLD